jgi:hypothetical protein
MPKRKPRSAELIADQIEIVGQFNDYAFESKLTFKQAVRKAFGPNLFPKTPRGRKFDQECKKIFERERDE